MNEIANFCERVGANVDMVRRGMGADPRIGSKFLYPGIGYGGSCFPKDVLALSKSAHDVNMNFEILESVMKVNDAQKTILFDPILQHFGGSLDGIRVAMWGLAFKPETDDIREAPSLYMIDRLVNAGATVVAFDPEAMENVKEKIGDTVEYKAKSMDALNDADCLLICTEWAQFRNPDFDEMEERMKAKVIFDGRNLYDMKKLMNKGWTYRSVGRVAVI
jgi:UDPglucose 6-dehydrogenase